MKITFHLYEVVSCSSISSNYGQWKEIFEKRLDALGFNYERIHEKLRIWNDSYPSRKTLKNHITYRDGFEVFRVSMDKSSRVTVVGFNFCRLFFKEGESHPAYESHSELFEKGKSPPVLRHLDLLNVFSIFLEQLNSINNPIIIPLDNIKFYNLDKKIKFKASNASTTAEGLSKEGFSKAILNFVRNRPAESAVEIEISLIDAFTLNKNKAAESANMACSVLSKEWKCSILKRKISTSEEFENWLKVDSNIKKIGVIALDGKKGDRPSKEVIDWMKEMEEQRIPYTLINSSVTSNPTYTRHGIAMHILAKAGGSHYHTESTSLPNLLEHWCIGLDLGIGSQYKGKVAVFSLTDGAGKLKAYWRAIKNSDETLTPEILIEGLSWVVEQAEKLSPNKNYIVIRDGRCPKTESIDIYKNTLPKGRSTFIEYIKKGNPIMCKGTEQPDAATLCIPKNSSHAFIFTAKAPQKGMLTNTVKFFSRHNELRYTLEQLGEILSSLCFSPKLSFQPSSLPSPIYWADGIASRSYTNLQFSGWSHLPNITRDFRV